MTEHMWSIDDTLRPRNSEPVRVVEIEEGHWGIVYIVENQQTGQRQAIKTLKDQFLKDELVVRRFIQEAHLWIQLPRHPHIVTADLVDTIKGRPCLFIEYVDGGSLRACLARGPLPVEKAVNLAFQLARGMRFLWQTRQIVHRDLKPENLMLTLSGQLKVTDFGLAHALGIAGTPPYMAPEQFYSVNLKTQTDIYAFGLILFEMLTGQIPHLPDNFSRLSKKEVDALIERRTCEPAPDPRRLNPTIPESIAHLILDCLMVEPGQRPVNFEVVCQRLEPFGARFYSVESPETHDSSYVLIDNLLGAGAARALNLSGQGASLSNLGRHEEALSLYDQALSANDQIGEIWKNKSTTLLALERYEEALTCSERALALGSQTAKLIGAEEARNIDLMSWTNKIAALSRMRRHHEALVACDEALKLDSTYPRLWNNKSATLMELGRLDEALTYIERAIELDADYEKAWSLKGQIQARRGDVKGALVAFERLLSINPRNIDGLLGKAQCFEMLGRAKEVEQLFKMIQRIDPQGYSRFLQQYMKLKLETTKVDSLTYLLAMGDLSSEAGDYQQAIAYYNRAIQVNPTCVDAWNNKGDCLYEIGETDAAVRCFQQVLELDPNHPDALLNLSRFYLDSGDMLQCLQFTERAIQANPQLNMAWNNRGAALARIGHYQEAIKSLGRALELNPSNALAWANLGICRLILGDRSGAETCFLEALALNPSLESARHLLEQCRKI